MRVLGYVLLSGVLVAAGVVGAVVIAKRIDTGKWGVPTRGDYVWAKQRLTGKVATPKVIYLHRGPITLVAGDDDASANRSSLVGHVGRKSADMPGFNSSDKRWASIRRCVQNQFAPFGVEVTDVRPKGRGYIMVVVGGRPSDLGHTGQHVAGLAPFNGKVIGDAVVLAFSRELGNKTRAVCETIAMEVGHAYGLDHSYYCKDVMTYKTGCGAKRFVDKDVRCGEKKPRECKGRTTAETQNSYRRLAELLGERPKQAAK